MPIYAHVPKPSLNLSVQVQLSGGHYGNLPFMTAGCDRPRRSEPRTSACSAATHCLTSNVPTRTYAIVTRPGVCETSKQSRRERNPSDTALPLLQKCPPNNLSVLFRLV
jgi:hypothetical protein